MPPGEVNGSSNARVRASISLLGNSTSVPKSPKEIFSFGLDADTSGLFCGDDLSKALPMTDDPAVSETDADAGSFGSISCIRTREKLSGAIMADRSMTGGCTVATDLGL